MSLTTLSPPPVGTGGLGLTKYLIENTKALFDLAQTYIDSGLLPDEIVLKPKAQARAFAIMTTGLEIGLAPMASFRGIYITKKGRIAMMADLMLGIAMSAGASFVYVKNDATGCTIDWTRGASKGTCSFTVEDAEKAGLLNKDTYKQYLAAMLASRCRAMAARFAASDRLSGIYTPEELGAEVRVLESGDYEIIESGPAPARQAPPTTKATAAAGSVQSPPPAPAAAAGPSEAEAAVDRMWKEGEPAPGQPAPKPAPRSVKSATTSAEPAPPATDAPGAPVMTGEYPYKSPPRLTPYEAGAWPTMATVEDVMKYAKAVKLDRVAKFGADKVSAVEIPFAVAIDLGVSEKEPVVLRRCSARQVSELLAWLKEVHTKALTGTEAK